MRRALRLVPRFASRLARGGVLLLLLAPAAGAAPPTDGELAEAIAGRLGGTKGLTRELVRVSVEDRVATLSGVVSSLEKSWRAREVAGRTAGIVEIVDRTTVREAGRPDDAILEEVRRELARDRETAGLDLDASVAAGSVTLTGRINDARKRFTARNAAARVPGVLAVVDRIETPAASDERVREGIAAQLSGAVGSGVEGSYDLSVVEGVVTLRGTAPTVFAKLEAARIALSVNGAREVVDEVEVVPPGARRKSGPHEPGRRSGR